MKKTIKKILVTIAGSILLVLGIIGLFLPVLQGILFLIAGLTLLSTEYHWPSRIITRFKTYFDREKAKNESKKNRKHAMKNNMTDTGKLEGKPAKLTKE